jgi:hypothetical protein
MPVAFRMVYKLTKYWRCYILLLIASVLSFGLLYIGQNDPKLELYLPSYFKLGGSNSYYYFQKNGALEKIFKLMENVTLDYEYVNPKSRYCIKDVNVNDENSDDNHDKFKILFLSISESANFKNRQAARQTYIKYLKKFDLKLLFLVGQQDDETIKAKLESEMSQHDDILQIKMPDNNDNFTSIKTLIGLRWAITYCLNVDYLYIISDYAVINHKLLNKYLYTDALFSPKYINDSVIAGYCNYTDEKLATALKLFFKKTDKKNPSSKPYEGKYCSNLGWIVTMKSAKQLWFTALQLNSMIKYAPAFLNGYLAHKANLKHLNLFDYDDNVKHNENENCLDIFQLHERKFLCAENFSMQNRYNNYIATWNTANDQHHFGLSKL